MAESSRVMKKGKKSENRANSEAMRPTMSTPNGASQHPARSRNMEPQEHGLLKLLLDVPETQAIFGFDEYASVLASAIIGTDPHFTIGVFGRWGTGKTTLLRAVQNVVDSSYPGTVLTVFFDAWRYQREEHMLLPILDTVSEHLRQAETRWRELGDKLRRLTVSMTTAMTFKLPGLEFDSEKAIRQWQTEKVRSDYFGWLNELQTALDDARRDEPSRRIVILIDDLDRCLPPKVVEVLESIKVMLDVTGFIFVLALDESVVEQAIQAYYGPNYSVPGRDYIKKLVQVEFRLPPLRRQDVKDYVEVLRQRVGLTDEQACLALEQLVPMVVGDNPRDVKRFVNSVLLTTAVMRNVGVMVSVHHQVAFMAMEFLWPGLLREVVRTELTWSKVKEYVETEAQGKASSLSAEEQTVLRGILENRPGLGSFLGKPPGEELLYLSEAAFGELVYYATITTAKEMVETAREVIDEVLDELTENENKMLQLLFGLRGYAPRTLREVASEFDSSEGDIRMVAGKAVRKLRHPTRSRKLRKLISHMDELDDPCASLLSAIFQYPEQLYMPLEQSSTE